MRRDRPMGCGLGIKFKTETQFQFYKNGSHVVVVAHS